MVIAFDKDISETAIIMECDKFIDCIDVYYILDKDGLLNEKESPMDDKGKFKKLFENNRYSFVKG